MLTSNWPEAFEIRFEDRAPLSAQDVHHGGAMAVYPDDYGT